MTSTPTTMLTLTTISYATEPDGEFVILPSVRARLQETDNQPGLTLTFKAQTPDEIDNIALETLPLVTGSQLYFRITTYDLGTNTVCDRVALIRQQIVERASRWEFATGPRGTDVYVITVETIPA